MKAFRKAQPREGLNGMLTVDLVKYIKLVDENNQEAKTLTCKESIRYPT